MFHPTLIDGSGLGVGGLLDELEGTQHADQDQSEKLLFLPLAYESFYAVETIRKQCYFRIKKSSVSFRHDLFSLTIEYFNTAGKKIAELKDFTNKQVRDKKHINANSPASVSPPNKLQMPSSTDRHDQSEQHPLSRNRQSIVNDLKTIIAELVQVPPEKIHDQIGYYEIGLNSASLLDIVKQLEAKVHAKLPPTLLFEYCTIRELAEYLESNYPNVFSKYTRTGNQAERGVAPLPQPLQRLPQSKTYPVTSRHGSASDIAVIGMAGKYPEADTIQEFWENLRTGRNCVREIPESRWNWRQYAGIGDGG